MENFVKTFNFMGEQANQVNGAVSSNGHTDMWTGMQGKLNYEYAKAELDLRKNQALLNQKYWHEQQIVEMKIQYQSYLELMGCTVYQDSSRRMIYALTNPANNLIKSKVLLGVSGYEAICYICYSPQIYSALEIRWDGCGQRAICFWDLTKGITPERFLKGLKSKGLLFQVSGRTEKKAAGALLAYSLQNAREKELPFQYGWNRMGNGEWHFAGKEEKVMREVEKHAI